MNEGGEPFFTIAVPACNVAPWIGECLASVRSQDFRDWECIVVVEESRDGTEAAARAAAAGDRRFAVVALPGPRSGSAATPRNAALDRAKGRYVVFLDGDDFLVENALSRLERRIRDVPDADVYTCAYDDFREGIGVVRTMDPWPPGAPPETTGPEATVALGLSLNNAPWLYVFRRGFLEEWKLRFPPGVECEDRVFTPQALYRARRVVPLRERACAYRTRSGSQMDHVRRAGFRLEHCAKAFRALLGFHAAVSREAGFDRRVALCWGRAWLAQMRSVWFGSASRAVPRRLRRETLREAISGGPGDFALLARGATPARRAAVLAMRVFASSALLAPLADWFLTGVYGPLAARKGAR